MSEDRVWHKPVVRFVDHHGVGLSCPECGNTELHWIGWVDDRKREKLLQCVSCGHTW